jgi:hypothetical protein
MPHYDDDFSYAFAARRQGVDEFQPPLYGYDKDEADPEQGYPFVDWSDLPPALRFLLTVPKGAEPQQYGYQKWAELGRVIGEVEDPRRARSVLSGLAEVQRKRAEEALRDLDDNPYLRNVQPGMERYLKADPGEIAAIMGKVRSGSTGREVTCSEPIPVFTCVWLEGGNTIRGVTPGSMSNAVTCAQPEPYDTRLDGSTVWRQRVFTT